VEGIAVGTISHHLWDHCFFVDVCPGLFLITYGTMWDHRSMVQTSWENAAGPKGQAFEASHEEAQVSSGTQKAGWMHDSVSIVHFVGVCWFLGCVLFCEKRLKWVRVRRASESIIYIFL